MWSKFLSKTYTLETVIRNSFHLPVVPSPMVDDSVGLAKISFNNGGHRMSMLARIYKFRVKVSNYAWV